jgi:hypothetical protein
MIQPEVEGTWRYAPILGLAGFDSLQKFVVSSTAVEANEAN